MSETTPATDDKTARAWRAAWSAVWSPPVAWVVSIAILMIGGRASPRDGMIAGALVGFVGLIGVFVVVGGALDALLATLDGSATSNRERTRLSLLSLFGTVWSLLGFGCLVVLGGIVLLLSPFNGIQH